MFRPTLYSYPLTREVRRTQPGLGRAHVSHDRHGVVCAPLSGLAPLSQQRLSNTQRAHPLPRHQAGQHDLALAPPSGPLLRTAAERSPVLWVVLGHALEEHRVPGRVG